MAGTQPKDRKPEPGLPEWVMIVRQLEAEARMEMQGGGVTGQAAQGPSVRPKARRTTSSSCAP